MWFLISLSFPCIVLHIYLYILSFFLLNHSKSNLQCVSTRSSPTKNERKKNGGGERWKYIYIYKLETVWISSTLDSANTLSLKPFWSTGFVRIHEFAYKNADIHNNAYKNAVTCMHWRRERVFFLVGGWENFFFSFFCPSFSRIPRFLPHK